MSRLVTLLLLALASSLFPCASHAQNYCDPNYSFLPAGAPPLTLYQVADPSHIVVMEYMPWLGPNAYPVYGTTGVPTLASLPGFDGLTYDTADCRVQGQHVAWMLSMGVDAILLDLSNVGQCLFTNPGENDNVGCATTPLNDLARAQTVLNNVRAIFAYYKQHNVPIRIIPMVDAQDGSIWTAYNDGTTGFQRALQFFQSYSGPASYQNNMVWYHGKPMLTMYTGTPYAHWGVNFLDAASNEINVIGMQNTFTYRFVTGFSDSQSPLWDTDTSGQIGGLHRMALAGSARPAQNPPLPYIPYPVWSWIDRLSADLTTLVPTYSVETAGAKPDNLAVTSAFSGTYCTSGPNPPACSPDYWSAVDTRTRGDTTSAVLDDFMTKAKVLQPRFLLLQQFNEFGLGDQGQTRYRTTDIEPTSSVDGGPGWGTDMLTLFTTKVADYKNALTRPVDMSTRLWVGTGNNLGIAGFTIAGPGPKKVLIRGFGPSMAPYFGNAVLANPTLTLTTVTGSIITTNDNWQQAANWMDIQALGAQPSNALESAILITLDPGNYNAFLQGVSGGTGIGLVDVYEVDNPGSPLSGLSTRGWVGAGINQMITGIVIGGTQPQKVLIRVAGPTLSQFGLPGLSDPMLTLTTANGTIIATNDNWQQAPNWPDIQAAGAPGDPRESAILITLNPGAYTAIVSGVGGTQGVALPSVYIQ